MNAPGSRSHSVPVQLWEDEDRDRIMLAAPIPGLQPGDIFVRIQSRRVRIEAALRGPEEPRRNLILNEWTVGPYDREVELPGSVDGPQTNASYANGVLVLAMPCRPAGQDSIPADFHLEVIEAARGEHIGRIGPAV